MVIEKYRYGKNVRDWIFIPIVALFGIYIVGVLIEDLFEVPNAVKYLFWAIGGIGFFATYFLNLNRKGRR